MPATATANAQTGTAQRAPDVLALQQRIAALEAENAELRKTPAMLAAAVDAAGTDVAKATAAAAELKDKYPSSPESAVADKKVAALAATAEQARAEAQRLAALGLRALKLTPRFTGDEAALDVSGAGLAKRWSFDAYDGQYHYKEAEKGSMYVTARVKVSSKNKDPKIPGLGLYRAEGASMVKVEMFMLRFAKWDDFGSYLGNESDYRNDFAHSSSIPMTMGAEITIDAIKKPLFIVAARPGCYNRNYERFQQPPVSYYRKGCSGFKDTLTPSDFAGGTLAVVQRID